jgi:hypothetical protein
MTKHYCTFGSIFLLFSKSYASSQFGGNGYNLTPPPTSGANHLNHGAYPRHDNHEDNLTNGNFHMDDLDLPPSAIPTESVEERLQSWRQAQQYKYEHQSPIDAANPRQEDGKLKLLASVGRGSIAMFFFLLMWRSVHHYEMADTSFQKNGLLRIMMVTPPVILFLGNMAGCVGSLVSPTSSSKKRMKAILNLNKLMELSLMTYNILRLVIFPSRFVLREIYVGRVLSNFLFLIQCQLFTKVTWNVTSMKSSSGIYEEEDEYMYGPSAGYSSSTSPLAHQGYYYSNDQDERNWR